MSMRIKKVEVEFIPGDTIDYAVEEAIDLAGEWNCIVEFNFNGVDMKVREFAEREYLVKMYHSKMGETP